MNDEDWEPSSGLGQPPQYHRQRRRAQQRSRQCPAHDQPLFEAVISATLTGKQVKPFAWLVVFAEEHTVVYQIPRLTSSRVLAVPADISLMSCHAT